MTRLSFVFFAATIFTALSANALSVLPRDHVTDIEDPHNKNYPYARDDELVYHQVARSSNAVEERDIDHELHSRATPGDTVDIINAAGASGAALAGNPKVKQAVSAGWCKTKKGWKSMVNKIKKPFSTGGNPEPPQTDPCIANPAAPAPGTAGGSAGTEASDPVASPPVTKRTLLDDRSLDEQFFPERRETLEVYGRANLAALSKGVETVSKAGDAAGAAGSVSGFFSSVKSKYKSKFKKFHL
ncbi:hypothetical protein D9757_012488 [Collybiopsis confluens]|uniref:Uncharacterized protein n=1 Tax=Collybiopsis confluens TaxID=2823264 RepID=A0A8H5GH81_9AGAR|nr:hypothetical protein D9757_012488 [Collybiopsis confluens]